MKQTFQSIQSQIAKLQAQAEKVRSDEIGGVVARIKDAISVYGLTQADLFGRGTGRAAAAPKRATGRVAKYSDGNGNVWGGRGPRPAWLRQAVAQGKTPEDFAVGRVATSPARAPKVVTKTATKKARGPKKGAVAIKYRDKDGNTWTGRGTKPRWLSAAIAAGAKQDEFLIAR